MFDGILRANFEQNYLKTYDCKIPKTSAARLGGEIQFVSLMQSVQLLEFLVSLSYIKYL